jgi:Na+/H+ antiporter NhaC
MRWLARIVLIITGVVVASIVLGILLVVLEANLDNPVASFLHSVAEWLVTPFKALFTLKQEKIQIAVNWGVAAIVYLVIGLLIARLVARGVPRLAGRFGRGT